VLTRSGQKITPSWRRPSQTKMLAGDPSCHGYWRVPPRQAFIERMGTEASTTISWSEAVSNTARKAQQELASVRQRPS
jgi:hypothetical protein